MSKVSNDLDYEYMRKTHINMVVDAVVKFGLESRFWIIPNVLTADLFIVDRIENKYLP